MGFGIPAAIVERHVLAQAVEQETMLAFFFQTVSGRSGYGISFQQPDKKPDFRNVITHGKMPGVDRANIHGMRRLLERTSEFLQHTTFAYIGGASAIEMQIVDVLGEAQQSVKLHRTSGPIGHRPSQLFQHGNRAFAAAKTHSIRYLAAWNYRALTPQCSILPEINRLARLRPRRVSDHVANYGH